MDSTKIVVGLSVGTLAFFAGVVGFMLLCFGLLFVLHYPKPQAAPVVPAYVAPPMFGARGAAEAAERKKALEAELGPVNTSAKQEVKNGLIANIRARAACRANARTAAICSQYSAAQYVAPQAVYAGPLYVSPVYSRPTPVPVYQPVFPSTVVYPSAPIAPPKPMANNTDDIDFQSCDQYGTCALKGGR